MQYDDAGNLVWSAAGLNLPSTSSCDHAAADASGRKVTRTYDALNRIETLSFPDGNGNQTWTYAPDGLPNIVTTSNAPGSSAITNQYVYNKRRLLKSETLSQSGWAARTISYGYDANGFLSSVTYPSSLSVNYAPNALGQPTQAGSYASGVTYYPNGAIHQFTYGNGIVHTMTQNARQLPGHVVNSGGVIDYTYSYDKNANVQQITDAITANNTRVMTYDGLDRLTSTLSAAFGGNGNLTYTYDVLDNLLTAKLTGVKQYNYGYHLATNRLTSITNDSGSSIFGFSYDLQGNVSSKNAQGFTFDYGNRLRQSELNGSVVEKYEYDAHGRRVNAWSPTLGNIRSVYGNDGVLRHQIDERTGKAIDYIYLGGSLIARVSNNVAPGAPYLTTDPTGTIPSAAYTVQWTSRAGTTTYELQEATGSGSWANIYSGSALSRSLSSKPAGTHHYRVRACNAQGCSAWSNTASVTVPPAPSTAPTLTAPTTGANGNYSVSWTSITNATSYQLEESFNGGSWTTSYSGSQISNAYTGKAAGTYTYRVKACNGVGCGPVSSTRTVNVVYAPSSAPTITTPAQSTGSYTVSWTSITGATTYRLEERFNSESWAQVQDSSATSRAFSGKHAGNWSYRVYACNAAGCSAASAIKTTEVLSPLGVPTLSAPANSSTGNYTVSWTSVSTATSYRLDESTNGGSTWTQIQDSASTSASISGRATGSYTYRVRACNVLTCGGVSNSATTQVLLPPAAPSTPSAPSNNTTGSYSVSWGSVSTAASYRLEESANGGSWGEIYNGSGTSTSVSGRVTGSYAYRARACNSSGCSSYSGTATTQVLLAPAGAPVVSVPSSSYNGSYTISWTTVTHASSYRLEESANGGAWNEIHNGASTSLGVSGRTTGTYSYRARACNTTGCGSYSATASIQVTLPPATPSLSVPSSSSTGSYTVSWSSVAHATSYRLEESVDGGGWTEVQNSASTSMAFSGRGSGTYGYRVRACNAAGCSAYSAAQSIVVTLVPSMPASFSVSISPSGGNYKYTASWSSSPGATSYEFSGGGRSYNGPNTSYQWNEPQASYDPFIEYYVRACNSSGCSGWRGPAFAQ